MLPFIKQDQSLIFSGLSSKFTICKAVLNIHPMQSLKWRKNLVWISLLAISLGYMESAVVVYLRALYYPNGFDFPLVVMDQQIALTELFREAATLVILFAIGIITGKSRPQKFAYFIYTFALWDIFYYAFLKILINWPESLLTWDILFLIPTTWIGPVLAPLIISITMIAFALLIIISEGKGKIVKFSRHTIWLLIIGSGIVILSFIWDYSSYMLEHFSFMQFISPTNTETKIAIAYQYIPRNFKWVLFLIGEILLVMGIYTEYSTKRKTSE